MQSTMMKRMLVIAGIALGLALSGCSNKHPDTAGANTHNKMSTAQKDADAAAAAAAARAKAEADARAAAEAAAKAAAANAQSAAKPTSNSVYFGYNLSDIEASAASTVLDGYVSWLNDHGGVSVTVEGNCDERGSREYNLALGQARADRVKDYLVAHGIAASRVDTVSFGEERPACTDSGETCWAQNRRADIVTR